MKSCPLIEEQTIIAIIVKLQVGSYFGFAQWHITNRTYVTGPEANRAEGPCGDEARRSAEEPEAPSEAPKHIRAVMRSDSSELHERYPKRARSDYCPAHLITGGEGAGHSIRLRHGC